VVAFKETYIARAFQEVEAQFDNDIIFISKNLGDTTSNPSVTESNQSTNCFSIRIRGRRSYFFITSMFTLVMSTFRENSGGNLVDLSNFRSTGVAIFA